VIIVSTIINHPVGLGSIEHYRFLSICHKQGRNQDSLFCSIFSCSFGDLYGVVLCFLPSFLSRFCHIIAKVRHIF